MWNQNHMECRATGNLTQEYSCGHSPEVTYFFWSRIPQTWAILPREQQRFQWRLPGWCSSKDLVPAPKEASADQKQNKKWQNKTILL